MGCVGESRKKKKKCCLGKEVTHESKFFCQDEKLYPKTFFFARFFGEKTTRPESLCFACPLKQSFFLKVPKNIGKHNDWVQSIFFLANSGKKKVLLAKKVTHESRIFCCKMKSWNAKNFFCKVAKPDSESNSNAREENNKRKLKRKCRGFHTRIKFANRGRERPGPSSQGDRNRVVETVPKSPNF